jgi:hypothetical protein
LPTLIGTSAAGVDAQPDNADAIAAAQHAATRLIVLSLLPFPWCKLGGECGIFKGPPTGRKE